MVNSAWVCSQMYRSVCPPLLAFGAEDTPAFVVDGGTFYSSTMTLLPVTPASLGTAFESSSRATELVYS